MSVLIPVGLGAASIAAAGVVIAGVAPGTSCDAGECTQPNTGAVIGWAIGGSLLLASAIVLWFVLDDSEPGESAAVGLSPSGIQLRLPLNL